MIDSHKSLLFLGSLAAAGCEILFGLSYVFSKQAASESGVSALLGWRFFCRDSCHEPFLSAVLYQGVGCSVFAFFLSNAAISRIGVNRASSFIGLSTVVSILAGILILEESFSVYQCIGAAVIVIGIYIANMQMK